MRWSFLEGKLVVNVRDGQTLGTISEADLVVDERTGEIRQLIVPQGGLLSFFGGVREWVIPWDAISQVGPQVVLVDVTLDPLDDGPQADHASGRDPEGD